MPYPERQRPSSGAHLAERGCVQPGSVETDGGYRAMDSTVSGDSLRLLRHRLVFGPKGGRERPRFGRRTGVFHGCAGDSERSLLRHESRHGGASGVGGPRPRTHLECSWMGLVSRGLLGARGHPRSHPAAGHGAGIPGSREITLSFSGDEVGEGVFRAVQVQPSAWQGFNDSFKKEEYEPRNIVQFTVMVKEGASKEN